MTLVQFKWDAVLISLRREVCPRARWDKAQRCWAMTETDAERFLQAAHTRLSFARNHSTISINDTVWVLGFLQGAPYRQEPLSHRTG